MYGGLVAGSAAASGVYSIGSRIKWCLIYTSLFNIASLILFTKCTQYFWMVVLRFFTGFFQVFVQIYMPVWADTFGADEKTKSLWMTILLLASPLGIVLGYTLTYYMILSHTWEWSFYIQAIALAPCVVCFLITPSRYIDIEQTIGYKNECIKKVEE